MRMASDGGDTQLLMEHEEGQVQRQQDAIAKIAHRPSERRDPVALILAGDVWQIGVVEDHCGAECQIGADEQQSAEPPDARR